MAVVLFASVAWGSTAAAAPFAGPQDLINPITGPGADTRAAEPSALATRSCPDAEPFEQLVAPVRGRDLGGGLRLGPIELQSDRVILPVQRDSGEVVARVYLQHPDVRGHHTRSLSIRLQTRFSKAQTPEQQAVVDALDVVVREIEARDPGGLGQKLSSNERSQWSQRRVAGLWLGAPLLLLVVCALVQAVRRRPVALRPELRANHLLPAILQCAIYAYWGMYVGRVADRTIDIGAQLMFAYTFDALLSLGRGRPWRPSFAPLPVVLSTNLFVWFNEPWLQCLTIAFALGSKEVFKRGGAHVFNPSAFGITAVALPTIFFPNLFPWGGPIPVLEMNLPPNMAELILCLALVAQLRFPIAMIPLGAVLALRAFQRFHIPVPDPSWPATVLILVLFATDPKTVPKTVAGRFLYGLCFGVSIACFSLLFAVNGLADPYAKVLPIPLLNLLVPQLDRAAAAALSAWGRFAARLGRGAPVAAFVLVALFIPGPWMLFVLAALAVVYVRRFTESKSNDPLSSIYEPRFNGLVVALWFAIAAVGIAQFKAASFQSMGHFENETPRVVVGERGFPTSTDNPAWCQPFSLPAELRAWAR